MDIQRLDKELMPVIAQLMGLSPDQCDEHNPSVIWLRVWLSKPQRTVEEFLYVVHHLQEKVLSLVEAYYYGTDDRAVEEFCMITGLQHDHACKLFDLYQEDKAVCVIKTAAEALSVHSPVLEGKWEKVAWYIFGYLSKYYEMYGPGSSKLSNWIIRVVGDPMMCPDLSLRHTMVLQFRIMVNIHNGNSKQAQDSLMSVFSTLDGRDVDCITLKLKDIMDLLVAFTHNNYPNKSHTSSQYLCKFDRNLAENLKQHRKTL